MRFVQTRFSEIARAAASDITVNSCVCNQRMITTRSTHTVCRGQPDGSRNLTLRRRFDIAFDHVPPVFRDATFAAKTHPYTASACVLITRK